MIQELGESSQEGFFTSLTERAVILIGANAVSMMVVEQEPGAASPGEVLEFLEQPLPLAEDIFRDARLSRGTVERCVRILESFAVTLGEYGLHMHQGVEGVATNILSEARNSDVLFNRLQVACGLTLRPLDEGDMTRLIYLSVAALLKEHHFLRRARLLAIHVGPGNTRLMLFNRGRIALYNSYRMGAHRVVEAVERLPTDSETMADLVRGHINGTLEQIEEAYAKEAIDMVLALGQEIQPGARHLAGGHSMVSIDNGALGRLAKRWSLLDEQDLAVKLDINVHAARVVASGLLCNVAIVERLGKEQVQVPGGRFEELFLSALAQAEFSTKFSTKRFADEVVQSAKALGKKYLYDRKHGQHVATLALKLFDELQGLLGMGPQDRLLLEVAAIVHEVGSFISRRSHHKHSLYIIRNSEIFGLNDEETTMVALIARYHRQAVPLPTHPYVRDLSRAERIRLCKLAALLRVADALDRSHTQRIRLESARVEKDKLRLCVGNVIQVSVEELALRAKGNLLEQVFGLEVVVETRGV